MRETGQETDLQRADDRARALGDGKELVRVGRDRLEGASIGGMQLGSGLLAPTAERVVGEHGDDRGHILRAGAPAHDRLGTVFDHGSPPSVQAG